MTELFAKKACCAGSRSATTAWSRREWAWGWATTIWTAIWILFKTHFAEDANGLYHNDGKGNFDDVTRSVAARVDTRYICWGAGIVDLDNDGYPDLFMVTGSVYPEVERKLPQYANKTPRAVFRNLGNGTFEELGEEAGPGVTEATAAAAAHSGISTTMGTSTFSSSIMNEPPSLLRNDMKQKQNWIKVKLEGVKSNRSAIGARVLAHYGGKVQAQAVLSQSSFYSCNDSRLHFGLGGIRTVDLDVYWPNGLHEQYKKPRSEPTDHSARGTGNCPQQGLGAKLAMERFRIRRSRRR